MVAAVTSDLIDQVRGLTHALIECARSGDWESGAIIEAERRPLLYELFGDASSAADTPHRSLIAEILEADREIMALAQQRHDELYDWLRQLSQGRSALKAYDSNAR